MLGASIEQALGLSSQLPRSIEHGVGFAMCNWLNDYIAGLHAVMTSAETEVVIRAALLENTARYAHSSLQGLLQHGSGDFRPAVRFIKDFVGDQVEVVTSHALNVSIWGNDRALEKERHAIAEARNGLNMLCQIYPEWAREQEKILEKHGH